MNLAKEMQDPKAATLVDGLDKSGTDYVIGLEVALVRERAGLEVAHTPLPHNISHADIRGDYEQAVAADSGGQIEARELLAFRSAVRYRPAAS